MVSNACNAYDELKKMPKFLMNELLRPISRDILESGGGKAKRRLSIGSKMSRADSVLSLRVSYNSYPIFDVKEDRMRFRYMRHWIESAHQKMHWKVPTLLRIAMDILDDTLTEGCCFHEPLERGDVLICNNATVVSTYVAGTMMLFYIITKILYFTLCPSHLRPMVEIHSMAILTMDHQDIWSEPGCKCKKLIFSNHPTNQHNDDTHEQSDNDDIMSMVNVE